jgi:nitrous oxide reductase accessory protein NosL
MRIVLTVVVGIVLIAAAAVAADEKPRCEQCGMFYEKSPTRLSVDVAVDGKQSSHIFESYGCYLNFMDETYGTDSNAEVKGIKVLDYTTFNAKKPLMLDATEAQYLYGTEPIAGTMAPFIAAFDGVKPALAAMDELGGEALDYEEMMARLSADGASGGCGSCTGCSGGGCGMGGEKKEG